MKAGGMDYSLIFIAKPDYSQQCLLVVVQGDLPVGNFRTTTWCQIVRQMSHLRSDLSSASSYLRERIRSRRVLAVGRARPELSCGLLLPPFVFCLPSSEHARQLLLSMIVGLQVSKHSHPFLLPGSAHGLHSSHVPSLQ